MDKKEILAKNKHDGLDEREQKIYNKSFGLGAIVVGVLCLVFSIYKAFHGEKFYEFGAIITAYICTTFFYQYKNIKKPMYLIGGIVAFVGALVCTVLFFMVRVG